MKLIENTGRNLKIIACAVALGGAMALAGCGGEAEAPAAVAGQVPGVTISNARMVLNAVDGNPAAVYFDLKYDGNRGLTVRKAEVAGAGMTMMHDYGEFDYKVQMMEALPVALKKGDTVSFKPGGLHIMTMEPSPDLKPGGKAEVTLTVAGGDTHKFEADIVAAGDEAAGGEAN